MTGFLLQFIGSRALHSSFAVVQLGVTLVMSGIRASLRSRRLHKHDNLMGLDPDRYEGYELDWLASTMAINSFEVPLAGRSLDSDMEDIIEKLSELGLSIIKKRPTGQTSENVPVMWGVIQDLCHQERKRDDSSAAALRALEKWRFYRECYGDRMKDKRLVTMRCMRIRFKYRARLARLTGFDPPIEPTQRSSIWELKYVRVREQALILADGIEKTAKALYAKADNAVMIAELWQKVRAICWPVSCVAFNGEKTVPGELDDKVVMNQIHLTLMRQTGPDRSAGQSWTADRSEVETILGLWAWGLGSFKI